MSLLIFAGLIVLTVATIAGALAMARVVIFALWSAPRRPPHGWSAVSSLPVPLPGFHRRLSGREPGDRNPIGGAADIVEPERMAELDRRRVPAVLAADADLYVG